MGSRCMSGEEIKEKKNADLVVSDNEQHFFTSILQQMTSERRKCLFLGLFQFCIKYDPIKNRCALERKKHSVSFLIYSSAR